MPSDQLVDQRIRNRLFEYVEWVCESEHSAPELGLNELLNQWEDFRSRPITTLTFPAPVYTAMEVEALSAVDAAWEKLCGATPASITDENAAMVLPEWRNFVAAARAAVGVFEQRGRMHEDAATDS